MEKFTKLSGVAAPFTRINVDTDLIIPAEYLKTIRRTGLGKHLFSYIRYNDDGSQKKEFILNKAHYKKSIILITGKNFGCGSSREHAAWSLLDYGFRAIISTSFADIFQNNSLKNGLITIVVNLEIHKWLLEHPATQLTVDLDNTQIYLENRKAISFPIDSFARYCLLNGVDQLSYLMNHDSEISAYENKQQ